MKRLTFVKSLLISPFISLSAFAVASRDSQSEYQKCYQRTSSAAFAEGLTPKELDWFIKELLRVEPRGDLAGNFGKDFIIKFSRYLESSKVFCKGLNFVGNIRLLSVFRVGYSRLSGNQEVDNFCETFCQSILTRLLNNLKVNKFYA